jgi:Ser/Thr protein kinase RdoA (MazF antagonist)
MSGQAASEIPELFAHFGAAEVPERSIYPYSPVFPCRIDGRPAVIKRTRSRPVDAAAVVAVTRQWAAAGVPVVTPLTVSVANPVRLGEATWVAYPYIEGEPYTGTREQVAAAGDLLGRLHAAPGDARMPPFVWPEHGPDSVAEDVAALHAVVAPHTPPEVVARLEKLVAGFMAEVLPVLRDAPLPTVNGCLDYKANNLVYRDGQPVLVDPDNGDFAPRLLDLALAALLFHTEHEPAPPRMFDHAEWQVFIGAYLRHVRLTAEERVRWPAALEYMLSEFGVWALTSDPDDWVPHRQRAFLRDLAAAHHGRFPLS